MIAQLWNVLNAIMVCKFKPTSKQLFKRVLVKFFYSSSEFNAVFGDIITGHFVYYFGRNFESQFFYKIKILCLQTYNV
jgi:hypothetical protein